jgi:hypothetical protein
MTNPWGYFAIFLSGIIAGLVLYIRIKRPDTVNNESLSVGKIKSSGEGSTQNTTLDLLDKLSSGVQNRKPLIDRLLPGRRLRVQARAERRLARRADPPPV